MSEKTVELHLNYYKRGDDLAECLDNNKTAYEALKAHAKKMRLVAEHLDMVAEKIKGEKISIHADTHYISITCEEKLAAELVKAKLADYDPDEEFAFDTGDFETDKKN